MKKILAVLCIGILAMTIGCTSEAKPTEQPIRVTLDMTRTYIADTYDSGRGYDQEAGPGNEFYLLYFTIENLNYNKEFDFRRYNMEINLCNVVYTPRFYYGPQGIDDATILKGGKIEGYLLYEAKKNDCDIYWRYNSNLPIETTTIRK